MKKKTSKKVEIRDRNFLQPSIFEVKFALQALLKNFLEMLEQCYRYLKGCPSLALSNGNKIMNIGHLNPEISKEM